MLVQSKQFSGVPGFTSASNSNGTWRKAPDGYIEQFGAITLSNGTGTITFPIPFPNGCAFVGLTPVTSTTTAAISCYLTANPTTTSAFVRGSLETVGVGGAITGASFTVEWRALGN